MSAGVSRRRCGCDHVSHLAWCATRSRLSKRTTWPTSLSQGGTTIANLVRYQKLVRNLGRRYSSPLGAQRCSNLVPHACAASCHRGFRHEHRDESRGAGRAQERELSSWTDHADHTTATRGRLQGFLGAKTKAVILGVAHGGAVPDTEHAESARWLGALSVE